MVAPPAIVAVALLQLLGVSIFVGQPRDQCSSAPHLGSWLFLLALLLVLWSFEVVPKRHLSLPPRLHIAVELLGSVFASELAILVGWCGYERLVHQLSRLICQRCPWCEYFTLAMLTVLPSAYLLLAVAPTQWRELLVQLLWRLPRPEADDYLLQYACDMHSYVRGVVYFFQLRREDRFRAIQLFQLQAERQHQSQQEQQQHVEQQQQHLELELAS